MNNHNEVCPSCKSSNVIADPESAEMKRQQQVKHRRRIGMPMSLASADMGLSTFIARTEKDASGYEIEPSMVSTMHRLSSWHFRTQVRTSSDRNQKSRMGAQKRWRKLRSS